LVAIPATVVNGGLRAEFQYQPGQVARRLAPTLRSQQQLSRNMDSGSRNGQSGAELPVRTASGVTCCKVWM
jgi:hypothetical protein